MEYSMLRLPDFNHKGFAKGAKSYTHTFVICRLNEKVKKTLPLNFWNQKRYYNEPDTTTDCSGTG